MTSTCKGGAQDLDLENVSSTTFCNVRWNGGGGGYRLELGVGVGPGGGFGVCY